MLVDALCLQGHVHSHARTPSLASAPVLLASCPRRPYPVENAKACAGFLGFKKSSVHIQATLLAPLEGLNEARFSLVD